MTLGGKLGATVGLILGLALGFIGPVWSSWEMGKRAGEIITWGKVPPALAVCEDMLRENDMNEIQSGYCADLVANAMRRKLSQ